jgi:hypothetical protein
MPKGNLLKSKGIYWLFTKDLGRFQIILPTLKTFVINRLFDMS